MVDIGLLNEPTLYLAAFDLGGQDRVLTIRAVLGEELKSKNKTEKKPVVYFVETRAKAEANGDGSKEKRFALNKTNQKVIIAMYGREVEAWKGKRITLYPTKAEAFGEMVDCIRVRAGVPAEPKKES